ncbi:MAG: AAA family ATPase [Syntrophobacterales bacterium]|jgi:CO dehydrogenase maturation factor|nr:AAA family ATPase [Syntrophobacterales bacterium]
MQKILAFAGKGGVGKTTLGGMLIRYLVEEINDGPVLAVDADPNSNLNEVLGLPVENTIGEARELMKKDVPPGMTKDIWFEHKVNQAIVEGKGFDLLVMGRPEGPGCYCAANSLAKQSIDSLKGNYTFVVVDNEAGMEHMSRLVTQDVDHLFVISDGQPRGLITAKRILDLSGELKLNIKNTYLLVNRLKEEDLETIARVVLEMGLEVTGTVRDGKDVLQADAAGKTIFDLDRTSPALLDAYRIFEKTVSRQ